MYLPTLKTPPADMPVSLDEAKAHLQVEHGDHDAVIIIQILAATQHLDGYDGLLRRCLISQTWEREYDCFDSCMRLPLAPVSTVSSITYTDSAGAAATLASTEYELLTDEIGPYVNIETQPSTDGGRVKITFVAGYGDATTIPATIKAAILLHVGSLYENREQEIVGFSFVKTGTYKSLIEPYRRWNI